MASDPYYLALEEVQSQVRQVIRWTAFPPPRQGGSVLRAAR